MGSVRFPRVGELTYLLTLPGHGFYWFLLPPVEETPDPLQPLARPLAEETATLAESTLAENTLAENTARKRGD
jgi:maltose alpha-D-glucosyltransferase/alpha-amylase